MRPIILVLLLMSLTALALPAGVLAGGAAGAEKPSLFGLGEEAVENMRMVGRGYGTGICGNGEIAEKGEIRQKAWSKIQQTCSKFTMGVMDRFSDDPNRIYSLCIGAALVGCQTAIGIAVPCDDLAACQAELGVP